MHSRRRDQAVPENDIFYGKIAQDETIMALYDPIMTRGLAEPILLTEDGYILSGHRRFVVCRATMKEIPCRIAHRIRREGIQTS
jgi:hypothetical protein